jgi:ELWxxDGT repeat protein
MVKDINPGSASYGGLSGNPLHLINYNGTLFFSAKDQTDGTELWKSDGTAAGTVMVKDIYPGFISYPGSSFVQSAWEDLRMLICRRF